MGKRGPKPKPTEAKRRTGNPGKRALPELHEVAQLPPPAEPPSPVRPLAPPGQESWERAWRVAGAWLAESDVDALQDYCEAVDDLALARQSFLEAYRADPTTAGLWRMRKQVIDCRNQTRQLRSDLGLTPASRAELGVAEVSIQKGLAGLMARETGGRPRTIDV